jgi:hypothetical protein
MVALALAPMLAVMASGDWLRVRASTYKKLLGVIPLVLLLFLASQLSPAGVTPQSLLLFLSISAAIVASQSVARVLCKDNPPLWTSVHLSFINGLVLIIMLCSITEAMPLFEWSVARDAILVACGILSIQGLYLWGLRNSAAIPSGLCIALNVPIAVLAEAFQARQIPQVIVIVTMAAYFIAVGLVSVWRWQQTGDFSWDSVPFR